ncbi:intercellular adhesion molecule 1 isoform X1 [Rousettus aegyptiacus]|uniref:Intercellular adhesion molecule 1 n=1 Tax=Rousettus aegyptiacus TaxID=9407 RepID=A0A7J8BSD9_ROUAE|nr:intercellular adhesion molecule 1 isoform X1 [Rousettus aegyptiacus]KAF6401210.1 intercellular adhesion molecule 1 [Rousettus aegyptiacus]
MAPDATQLTLPAILTLLGVLLPGPGGAQISVQPPKAIIPRGGSVQVNCSDSCDLLGLETQSIKREVAHGNNWKTYELSNIQEDGSPICFSNCHKQQTKVATSITVYWFPERVELESLPHWQPVGKNLTLRCQVEGGAPRPHLSVVLLRGEEELSRQMKVNLTEVTATVLAGRDDHGANFSCRTELDLRSEGLGLFQNISVPRQLRTFVLPVTNPHLATPLIMEVGTRQLVNCTLVGLFPASEAQVQLVLGDQKLEPTIKYNDDFLWASAWVEAKPKEEGNHQLTCAVTLGNESRMSHQTVTIYSFPPPSLNLSQLEVSELTVVSVECKAHAGAVVMLSGAPAGPPAPSAQFQLNVTAEDNGHSFLCSAVLEVAGEVLYKNETLKLSVLYGPQLNEKDCPGNWTWQEGSQQTLRCQASGNPTPKLDCRQNGTGSLLPIGDLHPVKREIAGTYVCRAKSSRGEVIRQVIVNVIYHDNNMIIIMLVTAAFIVSVVLTGAYLYNRQRKIREYKLQKAQEAAAMKLNTPP